MFKYLKNDKGVALIFVIIMLVVVGGLSAALLVSARGHVGTAVHEESMAQAFHSAEAGVEFVRANMSDTIDKLNDNSNNEANSIFDEKNLSSNLDRIKFNIYIEDEDDNKLKSVGEYDGYEREIEFLIEIQDIFTDKPLNFRKNDNYDIDDYFVSRGNNESRNAIRNGINLSEKTYDLNSEGWQNYKNDIINKFNINYEIENNDYSNSIENEFKIIEGSYSAFGGQSIKNSIVIIRDFMAVGGKFTLEDSIVFVYGLEEDRHGNEYGLLTDRGSPASNYPETINTPTIIDAYKLTNWKEK